ncbi:hypothetical protein [Ottowia sp.]|uniref:hypothetical protein n=1 Tax=Ottowia sp. TaxID=1898956 RepID=UPI0026166AAE|nr:hypothetical protein [Ottowia sp.]
MTSHRRKQTKLILLRADGTEITTLDFGELDLHPELRSGLMRALVACYGHTAVGMQRSVFTAIRVFAGFLVGIGWHKTLPLPAQALQRFRDEMVERSESMGNAAAYFATVSRLLQWCARNLTWLISRKAVLKVPPVPRDTRRRAPARTTPTENDLKAVLRSCYAAIDEVEGQLALGQRLLNGGANSDEERELCDLLHRCLAVGGGTLPKQRSLPKLERGLRNRTANAGGMRRLTSMLWLTTQGVFVYYLAILIQTSGNPLAILDLKVDCIRPHPLRDDLERLVWSKPRARREQLADFPRDRGRSAPALCRRLIELTAPLRDRAPARERDHLFLAVRQNDRRVRALSAGIIDLYAEQFQLAQGLTPFLLREFRRGGAKAHHQATGDIATAQQRLNHRSAATTAQYTGLGDVANRHEAVVRRFQGEFVRLAMGRSGRSKLAADSGEARTLPADTMFGFKCRDPYSGMAEGSRRGALCQQFSQCASCAGAIITLDDPKVVARLVATVRELTHLHARAVQEGWQARFLAIYEPTRRIIEKELLPAVAASVLDRATGFAIQYPIPHLD